MFLILLGLEITNVHKRGTFGALESLDVVSSRSKSSYKTRMELQVHPNAPKKWGYNQEAMHQVNVRD